MKLKVGILLMLASFIPWLLLPAAAWLASGAAQKATWSGGLLLLAEILFWPGLALAGKDTWDVAKSKGWKGTLPELLARLRN